MRGGGGWYLGPKGTLSGGGSRAKRVEKEWDGMSRVTNICSECAVSAVCERYHQ